MYTIHQVLDDPFEGDWTGLRAQVHDNATGKWAEHEWIDDDKLLATTFFDADDDIQDVSLSSHWENPVPDLYWDSAFPHGEVLDGFACLLDELDN